MKVFLNVIVILIRLYMLIFVLYVLVISNWHANVNSNWNAQYICMQDTFARATHSVGQARRATIGYLVYKQYICF